MNCRKCGKPLKDNVAFCTECGMPVAQTEEEGQLSEIESTKEQRAALFPNTPESLLNKTKRFLETKGVAKLNKNLSLATIVVAIGLKLLGFVFFVLGISAVNGYLIFLAYKKDGKINTRMCILGIAALLVWGIMFL